MAIRWRQKLYNKAMSSASWTSLTCNRHALNYRNRVAMEKDLCLVWIYEVMIIYESQLQTAPGFVSTTFLNLYIFPLGDFTDLSTQSDSREQWLEAGASCPPTAYKKLLYVATPTPPRLLAIGAHMLHLLVCGSKHSIDLRHELPSRPPTANSLPDYRRKFSLTHRTSADRCKNCQEEWQVLWAAAVMVVGWHFSNTCLESVWVFKTDNTENSEHCFKCSQLTDPTAKKCRIGKQIPCCLFLT